MVAKATRAHNKLAREGLMANAGPSEAYDLEHKNLQLELREGAGHKMALQKAVGTRHQKNMKG